MAGDLVLITGISGFIGYATLALALESGHHVRGIVRKQSQIEAIKRTLPTNLHSLVEFVVVEDLAAGNAFDDVMKGATYAVHIASPMPGTSQNWEQDYFRPAIDCTVNLLAAAKKTLTVKRVIITSSNAPFIPVSEFPTGVLSKPLCQSDDETCHYDMKGEFGHPVLAYAASKSMALDATKDFMETQQPSFDLVELMPAYVFGPNPLTQTPEDFVHGSNSILMNHLMGKEGSGMMTASVHIDDVAKCHVQSLDQSIPAGRYLLASDTTNWEEAIPVAKKFFPEAVGTTFVEDAEVKALKMVCDNEKAEKAFGITFKSFEEQIKSAVGYYLSLLSK